jgi:hypothetical protein
LQNDIEKIKTQSLKINEIIEKMLKITNYKTKNYLNKKKIIDLEASTSN